MSNEINYYDPPITAESVLRKHYFSSKSLLIMEDVMASNDAYNLVFQDILDIMKYGFEKDDVRKQTIHIKFKKTDKKSVVIELRHLLSNMILWKPLIEIDKTELLDASFIFDFSDFNTSKLMDYMNDKLLEIHDGDFASKNSMINDICHSIINISHAFCLLMGMGVSLYDIHQIELRNPEAAEIMHGGIDATLEPDEIEAELSNRTNRLIDIIVHDTGMNDLKPLFASGSGIKPAQFKEFVIKIGFKSDLSGNTIPILISNSFLMDGLNKPSYYYINALGGRKAALLAKLSIGRPGAFSKKVCQNTTSASYLREDNEVCDSVETIHYHILDDQFLKMLNGRYYYDESGKLQCLRWKNDKHLIGKVIEFRSPVTCNSTEGICRHCYGKLFDINNDMFSVGTLASLKLTEPIGQGILSAKHSQTTHSNAIKFTEGFDDVCETISTEIALKDDSAIDELLYLRLEDVQMEELDDSEFYYVDHFDLIDDKKDVIYHLAEEGGAKLYLNDALVTLYKARNKTKDTNGCIISLEDFDDESSLFTVEIKSQELSDPLKIFEGLLNRKDRMGTKTLSELCQKFAEGLIKMGTKYDLVHAETIVRALVRKRSNRLEFPDFSAAGDPNDVQILRLNDALYYNPSALVSMPYGYLRKQLLSTELYEKNASSHLDTLWVPKLSEFINA